MIRLRGTSGEGRSCRDGQAGVHARAPARRRPTSHVPPSSAARSRIELMPTPARAASRQPVAVVAHLELERVRRATGAPSQVVRVAVPRGVRDRLARDAVDGDLERGGQVVEALVGVDVDAQAA